MYMEGANRKNAYMDFDYATYLILEYYAKAKPFEICIYMSTLYQ